MERIRFDDLQLDFPHVHLLAVFWWAFNGLELLELGHVSVLTFTMSGSGGHTSVAVAILNV